MLTALVPWGHDAVDTPQLVSDTESARAHKACQGAGRGGTRPVHTGLTCRGTTRSMRALLPTRQGSAGPGVVRSG